MNQGKLEVVRQQRARVNIEILGISELKWTRMGEFNLDDHYIYYRGQESLRRNGVAVIVNKRQMDSHIEKNGVAPHTICKNYSKSCTYE